MKLQTIIVRNNVIFEVLFFSTKKGKNSYCKEMSSFEYQSFAEAWDKKFEGAFLIVREYDDFGNCCRQSTNVSRDKEKLLQQYHDICSGEKDVSDAQ